jgi:hypothetical protein
LFVRVIALSLAGLKHIFSEDFVLDLSNSSNKREAFERYLRIYYTKLELKDSIEPNELGIIADFCYYNYEFAKDLNLPNDKIALVLNLFFPFVTFQHLNTDSLGIYIPTDNYSEESSKQKLEEVFERFKAILLTFSADDPPNSLQVFTHEEIIKLLDYITHTYFKHFEVFSFVMGTTQPVQNKKVTIYIDEPIPTLPLKCAEEILPKEEEKKVIEKPIEEHVKEELHEEVAKQEKKEEEEMSLEKMIEALSLTEEEKEKLYAKIREMRENVDNKLAEREKNLLNTLTEMKTKGKKKK